MDRLRSSPIGVDQSSHCATGGRKVLRGPDEFKNELGEGAKNRRGGRGVEDGTDVGDVAGGGGRRRSPPAAGMDGRWRWEVDGDNGGV